MKTMLSIFVGHTGTKTYVYTDIYQNKTSTSAIKSIYFLSLHNKQNQKLFSCLWRILPRCSGLETLAHCSVYSACYYLWLFKVLHSKLHVCAVRLERHTWRRTCSVGPVSPKTRWQRLTCCGNTTRKTTTSLLPPAFCHSSHSAMGQ